MSLRQTSLRRTNQRRAIIDAICAAPGPLRPTDILELASRDMPSPGLSTVYRQLKRMMDTGEVRAVDLEISDVRYGLTERGHQHYFLCLCRECGRAYDIRRCPEGIERLAPPGFEVDEHEITLHGRCGCCSSANPNESTRHE